MKEFEVWSEGYAATGEHGEATFGGKFMANDFDGAVEKYLKQKQETDFPDVMKYYSKNERFAERNNEGIMPKIIVHSIWGCRLFDNETDARKSFG